MVVRLYLVSLAISALAAAAAPVAAQAQPPSPATSPALAHQILAAAAAAAPAAPAIPQATTSITAATAASAAQLAGTSSAAEPADQADFADPTEVVTPASPATVTAGERAVSGGAPAEREARTERAEQVQPENPGNIGEVSEKYLVSQRDADSFLGRFATRVKHLVEQAMSYLGTPYRRGGSSRSGVDCSGLVGAVYSQAGLALPRTAAEQFATGQKVAENDLRPGDLVFFHNTYKHGISHVGIFIGSGRFIHAAGHREGVIVSDLTRPYYRARYAGARRVAPQLAELGAAPAPGQPAAAHAEGGEPVDPPAATGPVTAAAPSAGP